MAWSSSNRRQRLPKDWPAIRARILKRDGYRCGLLLGGCLTVATEVDHRVRGDNHDESNLQAVCSSCHKKKTLVEAREASRRKRELRFRPSERHPGAC